MTSVTLYTTSKKKRSETCRHNYNREIEKGHIDRTEIDSTTIRINATMRAAWRRNLNEFVLYFQGSADSNYSQPSSDLSLDEEKESLRREKERQALNQLEKARVSH